MYTMARHRSTLSWRPVTAVCSVRHGDRRRGKESSSFTDGDPGELGIGKALRQSVKSMARTRALGESRKDREKAIKSREGQQLPGGG